MTTAYDHTRHVETLLTGIPQTTVYVGGVPGQVPLIDAQRIKPYVVIWPTTDGMPVESPLQEVSGPGSWEATITVAAADAVTVLKVATVVRDRLHGADTPGRGVLRVEDNRRRVQADPDASVKPPRFFLPLDVRADTPT